MAIRDIPDPIDLTKCQTIRRQAAPPGQPNVDRSALKAILVRLRYPISYPEFETFATTIQMFEGLGPHQQRTVPIAEQLMGGGSRRLTR